MSEIKLVAEPGEPMPFPEIHGIDCECSKCAPPTKVEGQQTTKMQVTPLEAECQLCGERLALAQNSYLTDQAMVDDIVIQLDKHNETCPKLQGSSQ